MKHMLFECKKVKDIWKAIGSYMHVNIQWKHLVIGYFSEQNNSTRIRNWIYCMTAYSIFKSNNYCKWKGTNYEICDVKRKIVNDLELFMKMQLYFKHDYIPVKTLSEIIQVLEP